MTLEQAKELFKSDVDSYGKPKAIMSKLTLIFKEFEEEKIMSCFGCVDFNGEDCNCQFSCKRNQYVLDRYKETA